MRLCEFADNRSCTLCQSFNIIAKRSSLEPKLRIYYNQENAKVPKLLCIAFLHTFINVYNLCSTWLY